MKSISRNTEVVSVSLSPKIAQKLELERRRKGQSRSAFISTLINNLSEDERWQRIYKRGELTARIFGVTSEEDIDRILHGK